MIQLINESWNWAGINALKVIKVNEFGNIIFQTDKDDYWRICPEELSCERIANSETELKQLLTLPDFIEDWEMKNLVDIAKSHLGDLKESEKFYLVKPGIIGGTYSIENIKKIPFSELIALSGSLALQIKDLEDGTVVRIVPTDIPKK